MKKHLVHDEERHREVIRRDIYRTYNRPQINYINKRLTLIVLIVVLVLFIIFSLTYIIKGSYAETQTKLTCTIEEDFNCYAAFTDDESLEISLTTETRNSFKIIGIEMRNCSTGDLTPENKLIPRGKTASIEIKGCYSPGYYREKILIVYLNTDSGLMHQTSGIIKYEGSSFLEQVFTDPFKEIIEK